LRGEHAVRMSRADAIRYIARDLEYGTANAEDWVMTAAFNGPFVHPAGCLIITWDSPTDSYTVVTVD
jgi:hypothetical protein